MDPLLIRRLTDSSSGPHCNIWFKIERRGVLTWRFWKCSERPAKSWHFHGPGLLVHIPISEKKRKYAATEQQFFPRELPGNIKSQIPSSAYFPEQNVEKPASLSGAKEAGWGNFFLLKVSVGKFWSTQPLSCFNNCLVCDSRWVARFFFCAPFQSGVNLGEYFSPTSWHLGQRHFYGPYWVVLVQDPFILQKRETFVSKLRHRAVFTVFIFPSNSYIYT